MAQPAVNGRSNILTKLDQRVPTRFLWQLTLLATLGGFLFGYDTSNIGSALNFVPYHLKGLALGYLVSGASLGAAAGADWSTRARATARRRSDDNRAAAPCVRRR